TREPMHGMPVVSPTGRSLDVHAGVPGLALRHDRSRSWDDFWRAATPAAIGAAATTLPDPADLLLHVCMHGAQRHANSSLQWIADAMIVMRTSTIDWDRLVRQAQRRRAS